MLQQLFIDEHKVKNSAISGWMFNFNAKSNEAAMLILESHIAFPRPVEGMKSLSIQGAL